MRKVMVKFWKIVIRFINWYFSKIFWGAAKGPLLTFVIFLIIAVLAKEFDFIAEDFLSRIAMELIVSLLFVCYTFAEDKWLKKFTKRYASPVEIMREFSNGAYLFGIVYWFITGELLIRTSLDAVFNIRIGFATFNIVSTVLFTFLWFTYHIYVNDRLGSEEHKRGIIKLKLQLFAAVASSISALFVVVEMWKELKILVTLLALVYTWLRYLIDAEGVEKQEGIEEVENIEHREA